VAVTQFSLAEALRVLRGPLTVGGPHGVTPDIQRQLSMLKALLLAAGLGSRLKPFTDSTPKCLLPFGGRPLLDFWLELLAEVNCAEARVNTHAHAEKMRAYLNSTFPSGYPVVSEFFEPSLLGSGGTIAANANFADDADDVIIVYADQLSTIDFRAMLAFHRQHGDPFTMLLYRVSNPTECGIVELDAQQRVVSFVEKPREPKSDLANAGIYIVSRDAYREMAAANGFDLAFDVLPRFVGRMRGWTWDEFHRDIGTHAALHKAHSELPSVKKTIAARRERRPAVFFDRDGTLIEAEHYLNKAEQVRMKPDAADVLSRLHAAGFQQIVVTNQSAIGRGLLSEEGLAEIHQAMTDQLSRHGVWVDAIYHCPVVPSSLDRELIEHPDRKPGPGMLLRAAADLNLDLSRSWMIGDLVSDARAGINAGCQGSILIGPPQSLADEVRDCAINECFYRAGALSEAADLILKTPKVDSVAAPCWESELETTA
jgi:histidinol-phosphate phosphatase family protein